MRLENLIPAQLPGIGREFFEPPGVVEFDTRRDPSAVAALGRLQAGMVKPVPALQKRACTEQIATEGMTIRLPGHGVAGQRRERRLERLERRTDPMLVFQNDRARLTRHQAVEAQRGLHGGMQHALAIPHAEARIVGVDSNSPQAGGTGQPGHQQLEFGFEVVGAHHGRRMFAQKLDDLAHDRIAVAAVDRAAQQRLRHVVIVGIWKGQPLNTFRGATAAPRPGPADHEIATAREIEPTGFHIGGEVRYRPALHHRGEIRFEAVGVGSGRVHHQTRLALAG